MGIIATAPSPSTLLPRGLQVLLTGLVLLLATTAVGVVALLNVVWFDLVNGIVESRDTIVRGLLFSSWLIVIGAPIVMLRPRAFGFSGGRIRQEIPLILGTTAAAVITTVGLLQVVGPIPYSDASLFIEAVDVPISEELVFRGVLLTALTAGMVRIWGPGSAAMISAIAIAIDGVAFGLGHLANATAWDSAFVIGQAAFASILGLLCAGLMARTRSIYPAIGLHAAVNAAVVLAS